MCYLPAGNSRRGHPKGRFKWPQLHQSCWNRTGREGWIWSLLGQVAARPEVRLEGEQEAGAETWDLHRATACTSRSQSWGDLVVQKLNGGQIRDSLLTLSQGVFLSEGTGKMLAMVVISFHKHQSSQRLSVMAGLEPRSLHTSLATSFWVSKSHFKGRRQGNICQKQIKWGGCTLAILLHSRFVHLQSEE